MRSLGGAAALVLALSFFGFGLHAIDNAVRTTTTFDVGAPFRVSPTMSFTPVSDWTNNADLTVSDTVLVLNRNGFQVTLSSGLELQPGQTAADFAQIFRDIADPGDQVGELETFTTTGGLHGVTWQVDTPTQVNSTWLIVNGQEMAQMLAFGSPGNLASVKDDLEAMAASITMSSSDGSGT